MEIEARKTEYRTDFCGELGEEQVGEELSLAGWVDTRRDHGGLIFVDLRDRSGLVQVVFDRDIDVSSHELAGELRKEYVIRVRGKLRYRSEETVNPDITTGRVELEAEEVNIFNKAKTPPFQLDEAEKTRESLRLKNRYLDLRRQKLQENLRLRHDVSQAVRNFLDESGFLEVETPVLTRSTPEGARDYVVPSRVHPGEFFALPQSPQLYKQLLMCSGFDRYFQIVKCFRDEDLRADRQPEFTQIDLEASFVSEEDIFSVSEGIVEEAAAAGEVQIPEPPFPRMSYEEALDRFGTDRPDTRFGLELTEVTEIFEETELGVFKSVLEDDGIIKVISVSGGAEWSRSRLDGYTEFAQSLGAGGLAWIKIKEDQWQSPIAKFLSEEEKENLREKAKLNPGDCVLFMADDEKLVNKILAELRLKIGEDEDLIDTSSQELIWVTDFPLMEYDPQQGRHVAIHHPFTAPAEDSLKYLPDQPEKAYSRAYDLVWNGVEIGGGSIRNHDLETQRLIFETLEISAEEVEQKFGFLLEALQYGAPPHGGIAFGYDRLLMLLAGEQSIRDVIAFPKTQRARDLLVDAPGPVTPTQLDELKIEVIDPDA